MVKVYFETSGYAELVATFIHESTYIKCLPQLKKQALLMGFDRVTETIEQESNMQPHNLDFNSWEELYEYILESKLNGQHKQSKEIYKSLSNQRQVEYIDWLRETLFYDCMPDEKLKEYQQIINYYEHE